MRGFHYVFAICAICIIGTEGVFTRCGLAKELVRQGLSRAKINDWVCLVESESSRDPTLRGGPNGNGSYDYGLFQINGKYWCRTGRPGGDCNIKCEDLLNNDISDDVQCAEKVYRRHGFSAWYGWKNKCKNKKIADVSYCFNKVRGSTLI